VEGNKSGVAFIYQKYVSKRSNDSLEAQNVFEKFTNG